jgi:hypothetical protein
MKRQRQRPRLVVAILMAVPLLVLWRPLLLGETFYAEDLSAQYFPREALLGRGASGWNPHQFLGMSLAGDPQTARYEPVRALARAAGVSDRLGLVAFLAFYWMVATAGTWAFARRLGASPGGAALAVLAAVWGGATIVRCRHPWMFPSIALSPWVALLAERLVDERRLAPALLLGAVIGWGALAGHPQPPYMLGLFAAAYVAVGTWRVLPPGERGWALVAQGARLAAAGMLAGGLLAFAYAPVVAVLANGARGSGGGLAFAASFPFNPWDWLRLLAPDLYGNDFAGTHFGRRNYHEQTAYLGIAPLALYALACLWRSGERERRLAGLALGFLALAAGPFLPPFYVAYFFVPGFRLFRAACRYGWFFAWLAAAVAGLALTRIAAGERPPPDAIGPRRLGRVLGWLAVAFAVVAAIALAWPGMDRLTRSGAHRTVAWGAARAAVLLVAVRVVLARWLAGASSPRATVRALVALTVVDLAAQWLPYRQTAGPRDAFPDAAVVRALAAAAPGRVFIYTPRAPGRPDIVPLLNWGEAAGYDDVRGYNQAAPRETIELLARADVLGRPLELPDALGNVEPADWLLDLAGVTRIAAPSGEWPARWRELPLEAAGGGWEVRRRGGALPRVWLVGAAERVTSGAAFARLPAIDPRRWALVEDEVGVPSPPAPAAGDARLVSFEDDRIIVEARAAGPALLVLAERFDRGWSVEVDGAPRPLLRVDGLLRGVELSTGVHRLAFRYRTPGAAIGQRITLGTFGLLGFGLVVAWRARRRSSRISLARA